MPDSRRRAPLQVLLDEDRHRRPDGEPESDAETYLRLRAELGKLRAGRRTVTQVPPPATTKPTPFFLLADVALVLAGAVLGLALARC